MSRLDRFITIEKLRANPLGADEFTPFSDISGFIRLFSSVSVSDVLERSISYTRDLASYASVLDSYKANLSKTLDDSILLSDIITAAFVKGLSSSGSISDALAFSTAKTLISSLSTEDFLSLLYSEAFEDSVQTESSLELNISKTLASETQVSSAITAKDLIKHIRSELEALDFLSKEVVAPGLASPISVTDAILVELIKYKALTSNAYLDSKVLLSFSRAILDFINTTELAEISFDKSLSSSSVSLDNITKKLTASHNSAASILDSLEIALKRIQELQDEAVAASSTELYVGKVLSSVHAVLDYKTLHSDKSMSSSFAAEELLVKTSNKNLNSIAYLAEVVQLAVGRAFELADYTYLESSIAKRFNTVFDSYASTSHLLEKNFSKKPEDSTLVNDIQSLALATIKQDVPIAQDYYTLLSHLRKNNILVVEDYETKDIGKSTSNIVLLEDLLNRVLGRSLESDAYAVVSGVVSMDNYFTEDYIDPGYSGVEQEF